MRSNSTWEKLNNLHLPTKCIHWVSWEVFF
jgi:hypothetical protein